jgi:hypothetical protein
MRRCGDCPYAERKCGKQIRRHVERCVSDKIRTVSARLSEVGDAKERRGRSPDRDVVHTYSFQARGFYERLGYAVFGTLDDYPPGQSRIFLHKAFVA